MFTSGLQGISTWMREEHPSQSAHLPGCCFTSSRPQPSSSHLTGNCDQKLLKPCFQEVVLQLIAQLESRTPFSAKNWLSFDLCVCVLTPVICIVYMPKASWLAAESYYHKLGISMLKEGGCFIDPGRGTCAILVWSVSLHCKLSQTTFHPVAIM